MTYSEQLQEIWRQYENAGMPTPASKTDVAAWAIEQDLWRPRPRDVISQCADDLARAFREEYKTDDRGRRFRCKNVVRVKKDGRQLYLWDDFATAPRKHMVKAFSQRRKQIVGDCHQLKVDVDCFNDARAPEEPIQVVLDFTEDVAEMQHLEELNYAA